MVAIRAFDARVCLARRADSPTAEEDNGLSHRPDVRRTLACERAFEYAGGHPILPLRVVSRNRVPVCSGFDS